MENVHIEKEKLLEILEKNAKLHKDVYKETKEIYKKNFISATKEILANAKSNKFKIDNLTMLSEPKNHVQDYEAAIQMIELDSRDVIVLSHKESCQYVLNKWDWFSSFRSTYYSNLSGYSGYSGSAGGFKMSDSAKTYLGYGSDDND